MDFWEIVGRNEISNSKEVENALTELRGRIELLSLDGVRGFYVEMKSSLGVLDSAPLRNLKINVPGLGSILQTEDGFLYSRCACVLSGRRAYEGVLRDVRNFKKYLDAELQGAEGLLHLADEVYERKTGEEMTLD